ncbi:MAG: LUD domain-containing protein [Candidatus Margulisbacteria bacterium]|nr:LUD domain-containing protein [Candidatus Margulisiibacteriota bacterium]
MGKWDTLADQATVEKTMAALKASGITTYYVGTGAEARQKFFELLPQGAEVMNNSSTTLIQLNIVDELIKSGKYNSVRNKLMAMDRKTENRQMQMMGSAPEWSVGSVHAITEDGHVMIASQSGSQLPGYAFGADHVIWVAGTHKIVKDREEGNKRIYEYVLPLENARAMKAYGKGSAVNKMLIINQDPAPRLNLILVNELLGF